MVKVAQDVRQNLNGWRHSFDLDRANNLTPEVRFAAFKGKDVTWMEGLPWITQSAAGQPIKVRVYVQPGVRVSAISGIFDQSLKIKIAAPASEGAANGVLIEFVAKILGISTRQIAILQGSRSRHKILGIGDCPVELIRAKLRV
jgi:uncharacterized protein (TIGR00251 family)